MDIDQIDNFLAPWGGTVYVAEFGRAFGAMIRSQSRCSGTDCIAEFARLSGESISVINDCIAGRIYPTQRILDALRMRMTNAEYARDKQ